MHNGLRTRTRQFSQSPTTATLIAVMLLITGGLLPVPNPRTSRSRASAFRYCRDYNDSEKFACFTVAT